MRMLLIAFGALAVIGGGAVAGYSYFMNSAKASIDPTSEEMTVSKADSQHKAKAKEDSSHYEYVELDPLILPIVDNAGVSQTVSLVIAIEVKSSAAKIKTEYMTPRLKDAYIQDMYGVLNKHAALKGGVIQVDVLKKRLNKVSERMIGEDDFSDVLLQVVQQRPI